MMTQVHSRTKVIRVTSRTPISTKIKLTILPLEVEAEALDRLRIIREN
jgi:hypothetical protein